MRSSLQPAPELSVIIPLSDDPDRAKAVFHALSASTLSRRRWELIVVASADAEEVLYASAERVTRVVWVNEVWRDRDAYLFNRGAEVARAPVLVFLASDVCVRPNTLEQMRRAMLNESLDAVVATIEPPEKADAVTRAAMLSEQWAHARCSGGSEYFALHAAAVRARAFADGGQLDEWQLHRGETAAMEFGLRLTALGYRVELRDGIRVTPHRRISWRQALRPSPLRRSPAPWMPLPPSAGKPTATRRFRQRERWLSAAMWTATAGLVYGRFASSNITMSVAGAGMLALVLGPSHFSHVRRSAGVATSLLASFMRGASLAAVAPRHLIDRARFHVVGEPPADPGFAALEEVAAPEKLPAPVRPQVAAIERMPVHAETASVASL
jgi:hypothetical protein